MGKRLTLNRQERQRLLGVIEMLERMHDRVCDEDGIDVSREIYDNSPAWDADQAIAAIEEVLGNSQLRDTQGESNG